MNCVIIFVGNLVKARTCRFQFTEHGEGIAKRSHSGEVRAGALSILRQLNKLFTELFGFHKICPREMKY